MFSIKELFKIGLGPSSSHTFGPVKACEYMKSNYNADYYDVTLYGSLALTGKGHLTDVSIKNVLKNCKVTFDFKTKCEHPNTMCIKAYSDHKEIASHIFVSIGGGQIEMDGKKNEEKPHIYPHSTMDDIQRYCREHHLRLNEYVNQFEKEDFDLYMDSIFEAMIQSVKEGLTKTGKLPGDLKLDRLANALYQSALSAEDSIDRNALLLASYAYATSEQNASVNVVVTAPTMGSCGVIPSILYHFYQDQHYQKKTLIEGLKVAGLIGLLIQENATISGAKAGCQAEIGAACSMAAAMIGYCQTQTNEQIECAAEIGLEHHLGLTCDPVGGYVMIPCIERNAVAAQRSVDAARLAKYLRNVRRNRVSFDMVVKTMNLTGNKLPIELKESSLGGLAIVVK